VKLGFSEERDEEDGFEYGRRMMKMKKRRSEIVKVGIISHFLGGLWWLLWWF